MPAIRPSIRSSGVAAAEAIVSGLAPGRFANTVTVGYSTSGNVAIGRKGKASAPSRNKAMLSRDVATGRLMNGAEIFIAQSGERYSNSENEVLLLHHKVFRNENPVRRESYTKTQSERQIV